MVLQSTIRRGAIWRGAAALSVLLIPLYVRAQQPAGTEGLATPAQRAPSGTLSPLRLPTDSLPGAYTALPFNTSFRIDGGAGPYRIVQSGDLPDGVLYQPGLNVVTLSGIPLTPGIFTSEFTVIDANGAQAAHTYSLNVRPYASGPPAPAVIGVPEVLHTTDTVKVFFPAVINVGESLHTGDSILDFGSARILLSETLHTTDTVSVFFPAVFNVAEALHTTDTISITTKVGMYPATASAGTYNAAYSQTFTAVGNTGMATITPSGTLSTGLTFATMAGQVKISGTPTQTGTFPFSIMVVDSGTGGTSTINYTLVINPASQTISIGTLPTPAYGGAAFSLTGVATATSGLTPTITLNSGPVSGSSTGPYTITGAGTASFTATQAGNANYAAATPVNFSVTVAPATLNVAANNANRVFDQPNPNFGFTFGSFVNGDTSSVVSGSPAITTRATPVSIVSGSPYPIGVSVGTLAAANYIFNFISGSLTITKASQVITFYPLANLTHGTTFPLSARTSSGLPVTYAVTGPAAISANVLSVTGTGLVQITASQPGNGNYNTATSIVRSFTAQ